MRESPAGDAPPAAPVLVNRLLRAAVQLISWVVPFITASQSLPTHDSETLRQNPLLSYMMIYPNLEPSTYISKYSMVTYPRRFVSWKSPEKAPRDCSVVLSSVVPHHPPTSGDDSDGADEVLFHSKLSATWTECSRQTACDRGPGRFPLARGSQREEG